MCGAVVAAQPTPVNFALGLSGPALTWRSLSNRPPAVGENCRLSVQLLPPAIAEPQPPVVENGAATLTLGGRVSRSPLLMSITLDAFGVESGAWPKSRGSGAMVSVAGRISTAPESHAPSWGRDTPRWSVDWSVHSEAAAGMMSSAGLPSSSSFVCAAPPLSASAFRPASDTPVTSPVPAEYE